MISFECPNCKYLLKAPDEAAGRKAKCKKCSNSLEVPRVDSDVETNSESLAPTPNRAAPLQSTKTCPFCGESVLAVAKKCKHCSSMLDPNSGGAHESEEILADCIANLFRGIESVGGRLKITSRRLLFEPHATNFQKNPAEILMSDIQDVRKKNFLGIVPNGMLVQTKSGVEYKFVVMHRVKLISIIAAKIKAQ